MVTTRGRLVDEAGQQAMVDVLEQADASSGSELSATSWIIPVRQASSSEAWTVNLRRNRSLRLERTTLCTIVTRAS